MKRRMTAFLLVLSLALGSLFLFSGCGASSSEKKQTTKEYVLYDLNADRTELLTESFTPESRGAHDMAVEFLNALSTQKAGGDRIRPIPSDVQVQSVTLDKETGLLTVSFSRAYSSISGMSEAMTRAAVVKTLLQIRGVEMVDFQVDHSELVDSSNNVVGAMDENSFVQGVTSETSPKQKTKLVLYYPDEDGKGLVGEEQTVTYSTSMPLYRVILEKLQKAPKTKGAHRAIAKETQILSLSVADGICYINFDSSFTTANEDVDLMTSVYAIVDSLTEMSSIVGVQISANGSNVSFTEDQEKGIIFHRDESMITNVVPESDGT